MLGPSTGTLRCFENDEGYGASVDSVDSVSMMVSGVLLVEDRWDTAAYAAELLDDTLSRRPLDRSCPTKGLLPRLERGRC